MDDMTAAQKWSQILLIPTAVQVITLASSVLVSGTLAKLQVKVPLKQIFDAIKMVETH